MQIFLLELRQRIGSLLIWLAAIVLFSGVYFSMFDALSSDALVQVISDFPKAYLQALGMDTDFTTVLGYLAMLGPYLTLFCAIFATNLGLRAVLPEEADGTADHLLTKPVTRTRVLTMKILADLFLIILFSLVIAGTDLLFIRIFTEGKTFDVPSYWLMIGGVLLMGVLFFSIGLVISMLLRQLDSPLPISLGITLGCYVLNTFNIIMDDTVLRYFVPFGYVEFTYIAEHGSMKSYGLIISLAVTGACILSSYLLYGQRDITSSV